LLLTYSDVVFIFIKIDSKELSVGRAALSSLLGGVGYFYGQSKIALPKGFTVSFRASLDISFICSYAVICSCSEKLLSQIPFF
jgi:hypothetical protein